MQQNEEKEYEVSVVVLTFNPSLRQLLLTLQSVLLQRDIRAQM